MPVTSSQRFQFGDGYELDLAAYELRRAGRALKLPRIPMELLLLLIEQRGNLVTRDLIIERIWGKEVFVDTDNSINAAIRKIRQVLKDDPEDPRFVQTVTGMGYRFIAAVNEVDFAQAKAVASSQGIALQELTPQASPNIGRVPASTASETESRQRFLAWRFWAAIFSVVVLILVALELYRVRRGTQSSATPAPVRVMLAVLPFQNLTGDTGQEYFSDGMTEEILTQLGSLDPQHLGVIARTSVMHYKGSQTPLDQIGRELGVQYVIEGSIRREADRIRISAQLIQMKDQSHLWAQEYDRELKGVLALQGEIAGDIANEIQLALGHRYEVNPTHRNASAPSSYEAYDLYLRGVYFWNKRDLSRCADYFQQAIAKDSNYARAYAGMANSYGLLSTWYYGSPNELMPKARAAALKALQLDETVAEAHVALGLIAESYDYDWQTAEREFRRAIELDPNYATAHQWYGEYLSFMGRFDEALVESEQSHKLDPLSLIVASDRGAVLYRARQYDRAIAQFRAVLDMDPAFVQSYEYLMTCYLRTGRFQDALDEVNKYIRPRSEAKGWATETMVYGAWGRTIEAEKTLAKMELLAGNDHSLTGRNSLLRVYIAMGRKDQAMAILEKFYSERSHIIITLKTEPFYDPLRSDPRFQGLLRRLNFPHSAEHAQ